MRVEVVELRVPRVDLDEVPVEPRVVAAPLDLAAPDGLERRAAGRGHVEALVDPAAERGAPNSPIGPRVP